MTDLIDTHRKTKTALPRGWRWALLRDVLQEAQGGFASGKRDPKGIIQLRMNNVTTRGGLDWSSCVRVPRGEAPLQDYLLRDGDVLFNNTNSTELVGKTALFENHGEPVVFSNHFTRLRTKADSLIPAFLAFWLRTQWQEGLFERICDRWIGQSAVQRDKLLALEIPLPTVEEQKRIVGILNEQIAAVERARSAAEIRLEAADELPAVYLRAVFAGAEARAWPVHRLGEVLRPRKEVVHPRDEPKGSATFVGLEHVESHTGRQLGAMHLEMSGLTGRKPRFRKGDLVYGYLRPYLNKVWIAAFDGLCSVDQYVFEVDRNRADTEFVAWFVRSPVYLERAPIDTTPGQLPRIRTEEVADVKIPLPALVEQRRVASVLAREMLVARQLRTALEEERKAITALPAAFLRQAFKGEL